MAASNPALDRFRSHLPRKPYCTDELAAGLKIRPLKDALKLAYIQPNGPGMVWVLPFDVDQAIIDPTNWCPVWETAGLPEPNFTAQSINTGRGHLFYLLAAGVTTTQAARIKPLRYLASIQRAYTVVLGADQGYSGLIAKNPCSDRWRVWEIHGNPFTLDELACYVDLKQARLYRRPSEANGLGRNVAMFDTGRKWSYKAIRGYWAPNGYPKWHQGVREQLEGINGQFQEPLPVSEVKSTAKSIAKWTWARFTPAGLQDLISRTHTPELQAKRGRMNSREGQVAKGLASGEARRLSSEQERATARLLRAKGYTQQKIADELGAPRRTVARWLG